MALAPNPKAVNGIKILAGIPYNKHRFFYFSYYAL